MTLWHKPGVGDIKLLKNLQGINYIVTLLKEKEGAPAIIKECEQLGIRNSHIELMGAKEIVLTDKQTV